MAYLGEKRVAAVTQAEESNPAIPAAFIPAPNGKHWLVVTSGRGQGKIADQVHVQVYPSLRPSCINEGGLVVKESG